MCITDYAWKHNPSQELNADFDRKLCAYAKKICYTALTMRKKPDSLSEYLLRVLREEDLSQSEIEKRARQKGHSISQAYLSRLLAGTHTNPSPAKLLALAAGLNRPIDELLTVVSGGNLRDTLRTPELTVLLSKFQQLQQVDQAELQIVIEMLDREIERRIYAHGVAKASKGGRGSPPPPTSVKR